MTTGFAPPKKPLGRPRKAYPADRVASLAYGPAVSAVVEVVATGQAREVACYGTRGDGKTVGALGAMLEHAALHQKAGFELPTFWIGVTDTFASHKLKTVRTMELPFWKGAWRIYDSGHVCEAIVNRQVAVHLDLFGIEDQGAMDRVRMECHGVWFEEPAPTAVLVSSSGVDEGAWTMALTSQRMGYRVGPHGEDLPGSHCYPALMTLNYPDEDHWTWTRFQPPTGPVDAARPETMLGYTPGDRSRVWVRIPPGERASATQRAEWTHALRERPDLLRRLIQGQPGTLLLGKQVAEGFREDLHVSPTRLDPIDGEPLFVGQDFGHTPTTIIGQPWRGSLRVYAALTTEHGGVAQHLENEVLPWLQRRAPWVLRQRRLIQGCYDVAGETGEQTDITQDPVSLLESRLGGLWYPGPVQWPSRQHTLISVFNRSVRPGQYALQLDPVDCVGLIRALSGRWHYPTDRLGAVRRDLPKKPNHPWEDYGDAFIYWLWGIQVEGNPPAEVTVVTDFSLDRLPAVQSAFAL